MPLVVLQDAIGQHVELDRVGIEQRARHAHGVAGAESVVTKGRRLRAAPADVLFGVRLGVGAVLLAPVGRDVLVERHLARRGEHGNSMLKPRSPQSRQVPPPP